MKISTDNLRNIGLFAQSNFAEKLSNAKITKGEQIAGGNTSRKKTSKENLCCSASISKESKNLFEQLHEENKQEESDLSTEQESSTIDGIAYKILETSPISFGSDKMHLVYAAFQGADSKKVGTLDFNSLASAYEEIRIGYESKYTGEELEEYLNRLNTDYEDAIAEIAECVKYAVKFRGLIEGKEGERKAIEAIFGMDMYGFNSMLRKMGVEENQPFRDSTTNSFNFDAIIKYLAQQARESNKI